MHRRAILVAAATAAFLLFAAPAWACGGLVAPNGTVQLVRTTTLAAYHQGVEHYVTSFEFAGGGGGEFGSIVPLPGVPTDVVRGGDWTLQRLVQETQPQPASARLAFAADSLETNAKVILKTKIDALDIVVLEGGGTAVGNWAREHGFLLPPDAPEVLDFYAERSPIFMTVRFSAERAKDQGVGTGDGTPVHVTIPTPNPWVPLRILALGAPAQAPVEADVYLLTDREPSLLPRPVASGGSVSAGNRPIGSVQGRVGRVDRVETPGLVLEQSRPASDLLMADLRSDKGMKWMPHSGMWLTYLRVDSRAGNLTYDLAVDASGAGQPSPVAAGLSAEGSSSVEEAVTTIAPVVWAVLLLLGGLALGGVLERRRIDRPAV